MPIAYIKDKKTFKTKMQASVKYDATLKSIYDEVTTVELNDGSFDKGDFIIVDGFVGIIDEIDRGKGLCKLTCSDIVTLFRRDMFPVADTPINGIEGFIKRQIDQNFTNVDDQAYRLPWLNVVGVTETPSDMQPDIENGLWNIKSFIAKARRLQNVFVDFTVNKNTLFVKIERRGRQTHNIDLTTSDYEVLEDSRSEQQIGRVTAYAEDTGEYSDWYRLKDARIVREYTTEARAAGKWEKLNVQSAENVETEVRNRFAQNSYSHLMEFATKREFGFYDKVLLRTKNGEVLESYISAVRKKSSDTRTIYKTGEARLMLDEKLNILLGGK